MTDTIPDFLASIPPLRQPRKAKPRKITTPGRYDLRKLYYDARRVMFEREYPAAWKAGEYYDSDYPDITTTNGHQTYIKNAINYLGHNADRNNTIGIPMLDDHGRPLLDSAGKLRYRKSTSTTGSTDMFNDIIVPGYPVAFSWKIEVKNKDTMAKAQIKYKAKMDRVGVLHSVIRVGELDFFWDEYYRIMSL